MELDYISCNMMVYEYKTYKTVQYNEVDMIPRNDDKTRSSKIIYRF